MTIRLSYMVGIILWRPMAITGQGRNQWIITLVSPVLRTPLLSKHGVRSSLPKMIPASVDSCPPLLSLGSKVMVPMLTPMLKKMEVSTIYNYFKLRFSLFRLELKGGHKGSSFEHHNILLYYKKWTYLYEPMPYFLEKTYSYIKINIWNLE